MNFDEYMKTVFGNQEKRKDADEPVKEREPEPSNRPRPTLTAPIMAFVQRKEK